MKMGMRIALMTLSFLSCGNQTQNKPIDPSSQTVVAISHSYSPPVLASTPVQSVQALSLDGLLGRWLILDSEGKPIIEGDWLEIRKQDNRLNGILHYHGTIRHVAVSEESGDYYLVEESGSKYKIGRTESTRGSAHNGIWIALDGIDLGNFQREDILKQLEGQ